MTTKNGTQKNVNDESKGNDSGSKTALTRDGRPIEQVILEKAMHGATPVEYSTRGSKWRTVLWYRNPELDAIRFSDGSTIYVGDLEQMDNERQLDTRLRDRPRTAVETLRGLANRRVFVPEREHGGPGTRPLGTHDSPGEEGESSVTREARLALEAQEHERIAKQLDLNEEELNPAKPTE